MQSTIRWALDVLVCQVDEKDCPDLPTCVSDCAYTKQIKKKPQVDRLVWLLQNRAMCAINSHDLVIVTASA
jgi:hypothetical protein